MSHYRNRGFTAVLETTDSGDFLQIYRHGTLVCEVAVSVFLDQGPQAQASIQIKRFSADHLQSVCTTDEFEENLPSMPHRRAV